MEKTAEVGIDYSNGVGRPLYTSSMMKRDSQRVLRELRKAKRRRAWQALLRALHIRTHY